MQKFVVIVLIGLLLAGIFNALLHVDICTATGKTIYVDDSGGTNYTSIQDAIDDADPGDTIYVYSGTYNENLDIDKTLTITGKNKENTIINGAVSGNIVEITVNYVNISGFTIQNAVGSEMKCVKMNNAQNCKITNNIIKNSNDGIYLLGSNGNTISGNTIKDNDAYGIFTYYSDNNILENNQIHYNQYGISIETNSDSNKIFNNDIRGKQGSYPQGMGINIGTSTSGNLVYQNYFNDFAQNAKDLGTGNTWYKSSTHEGNYWDDYNGVDQNPKDGIGDTPYNITDGSVQDIYPLGYFAGVNQPPTATIDSISPNPATQGQTVYFSGHGIDDGTIIAWEWKSDSVIISTSASFSTSSLSQGTHSISFRVKDNEGSWSNPAEEILIVNPSGQQNQKPTAEIVIINPNTATYGDPVYFHGFGIDSDGIIVAYNWRSNVDGFLNGGPTFTKSDLSVGTHIIYFKVKDNLGEWSNEVSASLIINFDSSHSNEPPTADAGGSYSGYVNASISFDGPGSTDDGTIISYQWDFGDETTATGISPTHVYTETGNYTVTLTVTDNGGKTDTDTTYANVSIQPTNGNGGKNKTPGFETIFVIISVTLILLWKRHKL